MHHKNYLPLLSKERKDTSKECLEQCFLSWILESLSALSCEKIEEMNTTNNTKQKKLNMALSYISSHLQTDIKINDIANHIHVSERTVRRIFQELTGKTIIQVINELKMKFVAHLLHQDYTLTQCADKLNQISPAQLSKLFKKTTGLSPNEFKKKSKQATYHPKLINPYE